MNTRAKKTSLSPGPDHRQWPLQVRQHHFGWTVTYYSQDGHVKHILTVDSQMQAFRAARNLVRAYRQSPIVLVITGKGESLVDVEKLLH